MVILRSARLEFDPMSNCGRDARVAGAGEKSYHFTPNAPGSAGPEPPIPLGRGTLGAHLAPTRGILGSPIPEPASSSRGPLEMLTCSKPTGAAPETYENGVIPGPVNLDQVP